MLNKKGETLSETLIALLIIGVASSILYLCSMSSTKIMNNANKSYNETYENIVNSVEKKDGYGTTTSTVSFKINGREVSPSITIEWFGLDTDIKSYEVKQ